MEVGCPIDVLVPSGEFSVIEVGKQYLSGFNTNILL